MSHQSRTRRCACGCPLRFLEVRCRPLQNSVAGHRWMEAAPLLQYPHHQQHRLKGCKPAGRAAGTDGNQRQSNKSSPSSSTSEHPLSVEPCRRRRSIPASPHPLSSMIHPTSPSFTVCSDNLPLIHARLWLSSVVPLDLALINTLTISFRKGPKTRRSCCCSIFLPLSGTHGRGASLSACDPLSLVFSCSSDGRRGPGARVGHERGLDVAVAVGEAAVPLHRALQPVVPRHLQHQ